MKIIDYYLAKAVISAIAIVTFLLIGLYIFILFIEQMDDIGKGNFGVLQAFNYALLRIPAQVYLFFPIASLLGSLIGLGILASNSELIVMRAAGFSITQITVAVMKAAFVLIVLVTAMGEVIVPKLLAFGESYKTTAVSEGQILSSLRGVWIHDKPYFVYIENVPADDYLEGISQYKFSEDRQLLEVLFAAEAEYRQDKWLLKDVVINQISEEQIHTETFTEFVWALKLDTAMLDLLSFEPEEMSLLQLYHYINDPRNRKLGDYKLAYWKRIIQPVSIGIMMLLAIPFIFGPLRTATMGSRFLAGASVGFGFYMLDRFFGPVSLVYQLPPAIAALIPSLVFALAGGLMLRRTK